MSQPKPDLLTCPECGEKTTTEYAQYHLNLHWSKMPHNVNYPIPHERFMICWRAAKAWERAQNIPPAPEESDPSV